MNEIHNRSFLEAQIYLFNCEPTIPMDFLG